MRFEWNEEKNLENLRKHQISFEDAQKAFLDRDEKHSQSEERYFCIGSLGERIATVRFTMRGKVIRIFGAGYWREGKRLYEER